MEKPRIEDEDFERDRQEVLNPDGSFRCYSSNSFDEAMAEWNREEKELHETDRTGHSGYIIAKFSLQELHTLVPMLRQARDDVKDDLCGADCVDISNTAIRLLNDEDSILASILKKLGDVPS